MNEEKLMSTCLSMFMGFYVNGDDIPSLLQLVCDSSCLVEAGVFMDSLNSINEIFGNQSQL